MKKAYRIPLLALVLVCLLLSMTFPCALAASTDCSLTLSYTPDGAPMAGVTFRVYRVAWVNQSRLTFTAVPPYSGYNVLGNTSVSWLERAETLRGYVLRDDLTPTEEISTNADGVAVFPRLETGLYLILGERAQRDGFIYDPVPFFLSLPNSYNKGETWVQDVTSSVKFERASVSETPLQRHVKKVWEDAGHEEARPESVTVELLRNGEVYDTVELNAENNWRWDWAELDPNSEWRLVEQNPGQNYDPSVAQVGITFLVTNTYDPPETPVRPHPSPSPSPSDDPSPSPGGEDPTDPTDPTPTPSVPPEPEEDLPEKDVPLDNLIPGGDDDPTPEEDLTDSDVPKDRLPQTGQLWWPVPILAVMGTFLLLGGLIRRKRSEAWDDEA